MSHLHRPIDPETQSPERKTVRQKQREACQVQSSTSVSAFPLRTLRCAVISLVLLARLWLWPAPALAGAFNYDTFFTFGGSDLTEDIAVGDLDRDGHLDLVVVNYDQQNIVYLNDGTGVFPSGASFGNRDDASSSVVLGDINGDNALDIIVGVKGGFGKNMIYLNDGLGHFSSGISFGNSQGPTLSVAVGDLNGDGVLDIVTGNLCGRQNMIYLNDGTGNFPSGNPFGSDQFSTYGVAVGDLNGDGTLDVIVGNWGEQNRIYFNDGTGNFPFSIPFGGVDSTNSVAVGDLDGDDDLDLIVGNAGQQNVIYLNDGTGKFSSGTPFGNQDWTTSIAVGDLNDDGSLDIIVGNASHQQNIVYLNDRGGGFTMGVPFGSQDSTSSVAMGDLDSDSHLDIVVGNNGQQNVIYLSDGTDSFSFSVPLSGQDSTNSVAVGDLDNDGDLDIVVGNGVPYNEERNVVYLNDGVGNFSSGIPFGGPDLTYSVAMGDLNSDGYLDIVVGRGGDSDSEEKNAVYLSGGSSSFPPTTSISFGDLDRTSSVAIGDLDGDTDLDIIVGNEDQQNLVYLNDGTGRFFSSNSFSGSDWTSSVAVGDLDSDGDLDIVVGNGEDVPPHSGQQNAVYLNDGTGNWSSGMPFGGLDLTYSVAVGDLNSDGTLDVVVGNSSEQNRIYFNDGTGNFPFSVPFGGVDRTHSIAVGDLDGDDDLDIIVGNAGQQNVIYLNDGTGTFSANTAFGGSDWSASVAVGDLNDDGSLDLVEGNTGHQNLIFLNSVRLATGLINNAPYLSVTRPITTGDANFYSSPVIVHSSTIPITYTLFDHERDPVHFIQASYSPDGGGRWFPAMTTTDTLSTNLATGYLTHTMATVPIPDESLVTSTLALTPTSQVHHLELALTISHTHNSQLAASLRTSWPAPTGTTVLLFDNVGGSGDGFRVTFSDQASRSITTTIDATATIGGVYRPMEPLSRFAGAPFNTPFTLIITDSISGETGTLEGWQLKSIGVDHVYTWDTFASGFFGQSDNVVFRLEALPGGKLPSQWPYASVHTFPFRVRGTQVRVMDETGQPLQNALVYRLPAGYPSGGGLMGSAEAPFRTSSQGYLSGHGELGLGDQLIALWPVTQTAKYTLYHTSAAPTVTGLDAFTVTQPGVQALTVSADNPLLLFDLDVSLEWDASNDPAFLTQLESNLAKTSAALYDWTNGQVALGKVAVYQAKEHWDKADLRIFASNQIRPIANRGGIVSGTTVLSITGPVFTGPITFTQGEIRIGPTWNRYGDPQPIGDDWPNVLAHELGHYALFLEDTYLGLDKDSGLLIPIETCTGTAMSDPYDDAWSEFHYYDGAWEQDCGGSLAEMPEWDIITRAYPALRAPPPGNTGPTAMPFAFTEIEIEAAPDHPVPLLDDFDIPLDDSLSDGRAYLIRPGEGLVDLGRPILNSVLARGAREGDEICVFATEHFACDSLSNSDPPQLDPQPAWRPEILLTPINTTTLQIQVNIGDSGSLTATIYPSGESPQVVTLTPSVVQTITLSQPAVESLVDVRGNGSDERVVTGYAIGAGPGRMKSHGGPGRMKSHGGPFTSGDGSVILYPPQDLPNDVFMVLQAATALPELTPTLTPIGRAYQIRPSATVTDFVGASLTFQYLGLDVLLAGGPQAEESLAVHYWDGTAWTRLETTLNTTQNFGSSPLPGAGLYVLTTGRLAPGINAPISPNSGSSGQIYTLAITGTNFMEPLAMMLHGDVGSYPLTITSVNTQTVLAQTPADLPADLYDLELVNAGGMTGTLPNAFAFYTTPPTDTCFFDDFQSGLWKWTALGEWGIVTLTSGEEAVTDSPNYPYPSAEDGETLTTTITSQPFDLTTCVNPVLSFQHDYELVVHDWITLEISTDDGATWQPLTGYTGQEVQSLAAVALDEEWRPVHWQTTSLNLAEGGIAPNATAARLRFTLVADDFASAKGWIIDEVGIESSGVVTPAPQVNGITPNSGIQDHIVSITNLAGVDFQSGAAVKLAQVEGSDMITAIHTVVVSATRITCTFDLSGTEIGAWDVVATNLDGQSGTLPGGFTVTAPPPQVNEITPDSWGTQDGILITELEGANFQDGGMVKLSRGDGTDVVSATHTFVTSATRITGIFDPAGAAPGMWDVVVTNPGGESGMLPAALMINDAPIADAGLDQSVNTNAFVTLDGSGSFDLNGDPLTYGWTQADGPIVLLSSDAISQPTFTTPDHPTVLTFTLAVTDALGLVSELDTVVVTVATQTRPSLQIIKLIDTGGLAETPLGGVITYTIVISNSGNGIASGVVMTDPMPAGITFGEWIDRGSAQSPPPVTWGPWDVTAHTAYTLSFTANVTGNISFGGQVITNTAYFTAANHAPDASNPVTFTIAERVVNQSPVADAGEDQTVIVSTTVTLDGSASFDPDGHTPLTYGWSQSGGTPVDFNRALSRTTFAALPVKDVLTFTLTVTDTGNLTDTDTVVITVAEQVVNQPPVADAGEDQTVIISTTVTLDGSASFDIDGHTPLIYDWTQSGGTPTVLLSNNTISKPTFIAPFITPNILTFTLTVTDSLGMTSIPDTMVITVTEHHIYLPLVARDN